MGFFSKLFKGPEIDMEKSRKNAEKMRLLFNQEVENGDTYRLIFGYTEDVSRFNYGFVHGSRTKIGNLIVGWNEDSQTIAVVPTVPDLSGCGTPVFYRRSEILKAYRNKYPTDAFIIYPDKKGYIGINAYDWLEDEKLYVYVEQAEELGAVAIGMDIDHSFNGQGQPDNVLGNAMRPKTLAEIASYCKRTKLPFLIKGVLSAQDAQKCLDAGAGGVLVSHHHGIMASAVPALLVLPEIVKTLRGKIPVFVDGSFENGMDVFKALALGADAVCVGRALMPPIQQQGAAGCQRTLEDITAELAAAMARTGSRDVRHIDPSLLWIDGKHLH